MDRGRSAQTSGAYLIRQVLRNEILRVAPKPKPFQPLSNSDCHFATYINDGRGDLKSCGTVVRMCVTFDHHNLPCGKPHDHTYPLSLTDRALIMGLALLYQRQCGNSWSITHRPTKAFVDSFPIKPLPSPDNSEAFLKELQEQLQQGVARFTKDNPRETSVAERIRPQLEGLFGWHDYWSEDGSYNVEAHTRADSEDGTATEHGAAVPLPSSMATARYGGPSQSSTIKKALMQPENVPNTLPSPSKAPIDGGRQHTRASSEDSAATKHVPPISLPTSMVTPRFERPSQSSTIKKGLMQPGKVPNTLPSSSKAPIDGGRQTIAGISVKYREIQNKKHADSSKSRRRHYKGTIIIPDSEGEDADDEEEDEEDDEEHSKPPSKKRKST